MQQACDSLPAGAQPTHRARRQRGCRARRVARAAGLVAGLVAVQAMLLGPALTGHRVLLPLDTLASGKDYLLEARAGLPLAPPKTYMLSDAVTVFEPFRRALAQQVRQGHLPIWNPAIFGGAPLLAASQPGAFSPFTALYLLWPSPFALAWIHLLKSVFAGVGFFLWARRALRVGYGPAWLAAQLFPICAFMTFWALFPLSEVVAWLPWLLLAIHALARRPSGRSLAGGAVTVAGPLLAGHPATAAALLLVALAYAAFALLHAHGWRGLAQPRGRRSIAALGAMALLGALLSLPQTLPTLEYLQHSHRAATRAGGALDFPPCGLHVWPLAAIPRFAGTIGTDSIWLPSAGKSPIESAAAASVGVLAGLGLAPLAWWSRRHRAAVWFLAALALFGLAQPLDLPLARPLFLLPPFTWLQNNRFTFATAFALLALAAVGLDALRHVRLARRRDWVALAPPLALLLALTVLLLHRLWVPPPDLRPHLLNLGLTTAEYGAPDRIADPHVRGLLQEFRHHQAAGLALCVSTILWMGLVAFRQGRRPLVRAAVALAAIAEVAGFAGSVLPKDPPALYYPPIPVFDALQRLPPGRVCPVACLPANFPMALGLRDVRGYDAYDPKRLVDLLERGRAPESPSESYAALIAYWPQHVLQPAAMSSIIHMLNVRYLVFAQDPSPLPTVLAGDGYWIAENPACLPRCFVPARVVVEPDPARRLAWLGAPGFRAADTSCVEAPLSMVDGSRPASGVARVVDEVPARVTVEADLDTPGLVVLADAWYPGWTVRVDGRRAPLHVVNHVLRGVEAPAGHSRLVFAYEPASLAWGLRGCALGAVLLLAAVRRRPTRRPLRPLRIVPTLAIVTLGALVYANSLHTPFIYDDDVAIARNLSIRDWTDWRAVLHPPGGGVTVQNRPILNLTLAWNFAAGGLNPYGYHLTNLALHLFAACLLYALLARLAPAHPHPPSSFSLHPSAFLISLLWVAHPLNTGAVTYIIQRAEVLAALMMLIVLYALTRVAEAQHARRVTGNSKVPSCPSPVPSFKFQVPSFESHFWAAAAVLACAIGMGCKETMVVAPLLALACDRAFLADSWRDVARRRGGLHAALMGTWLILALLLATQGGARHARTGFGSDVAPWHYLLTQAGVIPHYLRLAVWPDALCIDYHDWPLARHLRDLPPAAALTPLLALATAALWVRSPRRAFPAVAFFLLLAPTSSILPVADLVEEHRLYLPLAALLAFAISSFQFLVSRFPFHVCLFVILIPPLSLRTVWRNWDYRSPLAIWQAAAEVRPNNPRAWMNVAGLHALAGRHDLALPLFQRARELDPAYQPAALLSNIGNSLRELGRLDDARAALDAALEQDPDSASAHHNRALVLQAVGQAAEAQSEFETAARLRASGRSGSGGSGSGR